MTPTINELTVTDLHMYMHGGMFALEAREGLKLTPLPLNLAWPFVKYLLI